MVGRVGPRAVFWWDSHPLRQKKPVHANPFHGILLLPTVMVFWWSFMYKGVVGRQMWFFPKKEPVLLFGALRVGLCGASRRWSCPNRSPVDESLDERWQESDRTPAVTDLGDK